MKNKHIGLLVLLITLSAFTLVKGQKLFPDTLPNTLPDRFRIVLDMDSVSFYTKHKKEAKANLDNSLLYLNQFSKKDIFESGTIAYNYEIIENYLNEIVKKITPKELIEKYNIHVYPSKETEINAYAMYDGSIMFNIHNFIYLNNEAEVAHILAHEVGHQIQEYNATDEWLAYMNSGIFSDKKRKFEKASQNAEIDADYKAAIMLTASGYNNEAGISVEELFLKLETNLKNYKGYHSRNYLKTHPPSKNRLDSLKTWIIDLNGGSNYLVDSILFNKIKDESRLHSLKYSLETHNYFNCLEIAFEGYLAEGKENYAYYIAESGRRLLYTNKLKINNIMFSNYYKGMVDKNFIDIINKKIYLTPASDSIISYLKNQRLYVTKNFFDFFFNVVTEENNKEILLTKGLYEYNKSKGKKTNYLNNYVLKNGTYSKFINELLNPIDYGELKALYVFNSITTINCSGKKPIKLFFLEKNLIHQFDSLARETFLKKCFVKNKEVKNANSHINSNLQETLFLKNLSNLLFIKIKPKHKLSILSPELGNYLCTNKYTSLQYDDFYYQTCVNTELSIALGILTGISPTPTLYQTKTIEYNKNKKIILGKIKLSAGHLTLSQYKIRLSNAILKSKHS